MRHNWKDLISDPPKSEDFPVTVVQSLDRSNVGIWAPYIIELADEDKNEINTFFEEGELVRAEDWFISVI